MNPTHRMRRADVAYERKMRLYAYLAEHERWHSLRKLLVTIGGYLEPAQAREIAARGTTPPDLQRPYNTTLKKLLRDIDDLEALGLVVERRETDCTTTGEILTELRFARAAYAASEIELTEEHLAVLAVAAALARSAPDSPIAEDALAAIEKLLPGANLGSGLPVSVSFKVPRTERDADVINRRLHRLAEMIRRRHSVTFDYHKLDGSVSRRIVELYGLGERVGLWYAVGRDLGDDRIKSFRVSRMRGRPAERNADQGPRYAIPENFNLSEHIRPPWLIGDDETVVEVAFEPQVAHLARAMLQAASVSDMPDGRAVFTVTVLNVDGLVRWLMTFGDSAEVLAPASARTYAQDMRAAMEANRG